jgi:hypothetical protein
MQYCKDQGPQVKVMAEFVEEVAGFRVRLNFQSLSNAAHLLSGDFRAPIDRRSYHLFYTSYLIFSP